MKTEDTNPKAPIKLADLSFFAVDDHEYFLKVIKNMLLHLGARNLTSTSSVEEAKRICKKQQFNVYLVDYNLGSRENGRQLIHYLHENKLIPLDALILMLTGDASRAMVLSAIEEEPNDYLIKPFSMTQFRQRLERCINRHNELYDIYVAQREKRYEDIISMCYERLGKMSNYAPELRIMLSEASIHVGNIDQAQAILEEGLSFQESALYRLELGKIYNLQGNFEEALENLTLARQMLPYLMETYRIECNTYLQMGKIDEASKIIDEAIQISPQSSTLLRMQIDMSATQRNFFKMRDCIGSLMELHKYEKEKITHLLSSYVHSAILFTIQTPEQYHLDMLSRNINATIHRYANYLISDKEKFDVNLFEKVVQARINMTTGAAFRGKKELYQIIDKYKEEMPNLPQSIFSNVIAGLNQIGDYEYADKLSKEHYDGDSRDSEDPVLQRCIKIFNEDETLKERRDKYKDLNRQGINAYRTGNYAAALQFFDSALRKSPTNTIAIINKAQSLLKLAQKTGVKKNQKATYLNDCKEIIRNLDGLPLDQEQMIRVNDIKKELK